MRYILLLALAITGIACSHKQTSVTPVTACNPKVEHADSAKQASALLVGEWKLTAIQTDVDSSHRPLVPDQLITFKSDHTCIVTNNGQASALLAYTVTMGVPREAVNPGGFNIVLRPQLTVHPVQLSPLYSAPLGTSTLYICIQNIILDYGTAFDAPAYSYQRQTP